MFMEVGAYLGERRKSWGSPEGGALLSLVSRMTYKRAAIQRPERVIIGRAGAALGK